jgi:hypothetical protein
MCQGLRVLVLYMSAVREIVVLSDVRRTGVRRRAPELNGQETIWHFMRQNWLSNRIFKSFDDIHRPLLLRLEHTHRHLITQGSSGSLSDVNQ